MPASDPLDVVQRVLQILDDGSFTTTYKLAVMLALVELCFEEAAVPGPTGAVLTTPQLADKVLELYWPQVRAYGPHGLLQQSNNAPHQVGGRTLPVLIAHWQAGVGAGTTTLPYPVARRRPEFATLRDEVERVLIRMPLPKLQRVGGVHVPWLYEITWDDEPAPTDARLRRYQQTGTGFDNAVRLKPGVFEAFSRLAPLLRAFIQQRWVEKVTALNPVDDAGVALAEHLFGVDRTSLEATRGPLAELQAGRCFYCGDALRGATHVDHFLPWARFPDNGLANLVVADARCNGQKSDRLAGPEFLRLWRDRLTAETHPLEHIGARLRWDVGAERARGAARSLYLALPADARLWAGGARSVAIDRGLLDALLAG
ncbi:hypothetical protein L6V77_06490 [Myxococcota bacterium]|nr:hypothetical protein [Myxococcota bacterium]